MSSNNFPFVAAALAFLAAAVLLSVIFRFTFGRRLGLPRNGRARLPRLGTVDAFDLDRQRQLVIIRRDNVEHLLMIGGPNDLVIESQIIRAEGRDPRDFREARIRDKDLREDLREKDPKDTQPLPAGVSPWPAPAEMPLPNPPPRKMPFPAAAALEPETGATAGDPNEGQTPGFASSTVLSSPGPSPFPLPQRRASPFIAPPGQRPQNQREHFQGRADPSRRPESVSGAAKEFRRASVATPFLRSSTPRQTDGTAAKLASSSTTESPPTVPNAPSPLPGFDEIPASPEVNGTVESGPAPEAPITPSAPAIAAGDLFVDFPTVGPAFAGAGTLEAEMAKLLGRGQD